MSNTVACETLDAMCCVYGAHCATWIGKNEHGDRRYTNAAEYDVEHPEAIFGWTPPVIR